MLSYKIIEIEHFIKNIPNAKNEEYKKKINRKNTTSGKTDEVEGKIIRR